MYEDLASEVRSLALGVRAVVGGFTLMLSMISIHAAFVIRDFQKLYAEALPGEAMPPSTLFILWARTPLIILSIILPLLALVILVSVRSHKTALFLVAIIMVAVLVQMNLTCSYLMEPLIHIDMGMPGVPAAK